MKTYYEILGVSETATQDEIKKAFKKEMKKWHPDMNPNNNDAIEMAQLINEAYSVLSDKLKRKEYDSKQVNSNKQTKVYNDTGKKYTTYNRTYETDKKTAQHILEHFKKLNKISYDLYSDLLSNTEDSNEKKLDLIVSALEYISIICDTNLILIGLTRENINDGDYQNCEVSLNDLKDILHEYVRCLYVENALNTLKNKYSINNFNFTK